MGYRLPAVVDEFEFAALNKSYSNATWNTFTQVTSDFNAARCGSSAALNDERVFRLPQTLRAGTWTFVLAHVGATSAGQYQLAVSVDAVTWTNVGALIEGYTTGASPTRTERTGLTIPVGIRFVRVKVPSKNASSSSPTGRINGLYGVRTGA